MKKIIKLVIIMIHLLLLISSMLLVSANQSNVTYTYSYEGKIQLSPSAYKFLYEISDFGSAGSLNSPNDLVFDGERCIAVIADTGNNRIIITDSEFNTKLIISNFINDKGESDSFNSPQGVFISSEGFLYVADTENSRIVVFDKEFNFYKILLPISADILPENFKYNPKAVAVDRVNRVYVVSKNSNMGVIALDEDGVFEGFIGAQKVTANAFEAFKRMLMTEEQLLRSTSFVPVEYSNLDIDEKGFIYVTSSQIDRYSLYSAVNSRSTESAYAPIKKINPLGTDVLLRNGFFPPVGDVIFEAYDGKDSVDPSEITEISVLENGMYALLDSNGNKIFVYDSNGNLLYAFGGVGSAPGVYTSLCSMAFNGNFLYTLDMSEGTVTVSEKTDYGVLIDKVITYQNTREYDKANELWNEILKRNNNFDMAYLGIGKIALDKGDYDTAMHYFKLINNKKYWEKAYRLSREQFLSKYSMLVLAGAVVIIFSIIKFIGRIKYSNKKKLEMGASGKIIDEILFGFYLIMHPFKGYWGIKAEKRGSVRAASIWLAIGSFAAIFSSLATGYLLRDTSSTVVSALANTLFPLLLWCLSNICFTTLMNGKGTLKEVYTAVGYASIPYTLLTIPSTLVSHVMISDELSLLGLLSSLAVAWTLFLILCGMMTIHDYSFGKNLVVTVFTVFGIIFILFLLLVFFNLTGKMVALVVNIINEINYRM